MKRTKSLQKESSPQPETLSRLTQDILTAQASINREIRDEKLSVQKDCARLLSSAIQGTSTKDLEVDWDDYLPAFTLNDNLILKRPLLSAGTGTPTRPKQPLPNPGRDLDPSNEYVLRLGEGDLPDGLRASRDIVMTKVKNEKLHCSKESLRLIQKSTGSAGLSPQDLHELWDTVKVEGEPAKPIYTPLVISTANAFQFGGLSPEPQWSFISVSDKADSSVSKAPETETRVESPQPSLSGSSSRKPHNSQYHNAGEDGQTAPCEESSPAKRSVSVGLSLSCTSDDEHDGQDDHKSQAMGSQEHSETMIINLVSRNNTPCPGSQEVSTMANNSGQHDVAFPFHPVNNPNPISEPQREASPSQITNTTVTATEHTGTSQLKRRRDIQGDRTKRPKLQRERALSTQKPTTSSFTTLGSLSTFMETRSRAKRHIAKSAYFSNKSSDISHVQKDPVPENTPVPQKPSHDHHITISSQLTTQVPQCSSHHHAPPILFLSTALLKSHLQLVQSLERAEERPVIIYRDYNNNIEQTPKPAPTQTNQPIPPKEADIIISPTTSIILTTSQATTQRYLPGHRLHPHITSSSNNSNSIKETINSPLREQIFLLAPRYEHIYILITHTTPPPAQNTNPNRNHQQWTADEQILSNLASLAAFCASLAPHVTVQPLIIPSGTETVARWVLALAKRHAIAFPEGHQGLDSVEETCWEVFLRRVGLNPYAARAVLGSLEGSAGTGGGGGLSGLLEMPEQNQRVFNELIGERVFERMDGILGKDWQCDWALNFGDSQA
ncbi:hypothetical protein P168DRAFT_346034 [Aspergillus campestris IBT 28561]|uniref:Uncharacterized protein n=1 Tax=Aspergillus campestris (strain IBT 28561) TaxID=1392248 RepID=A0A2I1D0J8_ASPC2|nr:uncharacterized protein P168DRAFT_346034 [Aspergillus campestris IBT 28561]PKY03395.1 hypothetical protein P168DRAFT_346034 [Aspergillus campestris IBT 28561]